MKVRIKEIHVIETGETDLDRVREQIKDSAILLDECSFIEWQLEEVKE